MIKSDESKGLGIDTKHYKIVRIYFRLPPEIGGMEVHIAKLSDMQRQLGLEVLNVFNVGELKIDGVQLFKGFDLLRIRPAALRNFVFYLGALKARKRLISEKCIVLHVHGDWSDFLFSRFLAWVIKAKLTVASIHGVANPQRSLLYRLALKNFDLVFCTGNREKVLLSSTLKRNVYHFPSAPQDVFFERNDSSQVFSFDVISVANFYPNKRVDLIVDCAKELPTRKFAVIGDGEYRATLENRVEELGLQNIQFLGRKSPSEVANLLITARAFLLTSETEGTPTAVLEAMAVGLPVVVTPSNDYSWLIEEGRCGYVTKSWQVEEIVEKLDKVLSNEQNRLVMGRTSKVVAENFSWRANVEYFNSILAEKIRFKDSQ